MENISENSDRKIARYFVFQQRSRNEKWTADDVAKSALQNLLIADLLTPEQLVRERSTSKGLIFLDCTIHGPAILAPQPASRFTDCTFISDPDLEYPDSLFYQPDPNRRW